VKGLTLKEKGRGGGGMGEKFRKSLLRPLETSANSERRSKTGLRLFIELSWGGRKARHQIKIQLYNLRLEQRRDWGQLSTPYLILAHQRDHEGD